MIKLWQIAQVAWGSTMLGLSLAAAQAPVASDQATRQLQELSAPSEQEAKQAQKQSKKASAADRKAIQKALKQDRQTAKAQAKKDKADPAKRSQVLGFRG
jgi:uncharacterized membrane protein YhiD involved in acid resistance